MILWQIIRRIIAIELSEEMTAGEDSKNEMP